MCCKTKSNPIQSVYRIQSIVFLSISFITHTVVVQFRIIIIISFFFRIERERGNEKKNDHLILKEISFEFCQRWISICFFVFVNFHEIIFFSYVLFYNIYIWSNDGININNEARRFLNVLKMLSLLFLVFFLPI